MPWWFLLWTLSGLFWVPTVLVAAGLFVIGRLLTRPGLRIACFSLATLLVLSVLSVYCYSWMGHAF